MEREGSEATGRVLRSDLYFHGLQPGRCVSQHLYRVDSRGELFVWRCCQTPCPLGELKTRSMPMDHAYTFAQCLLPWPCESPCRGTQRVGVRAEERGCLPAALPSLASDSSPLMCLCCFQTHAHPGQECFHQLTSSWTQSICIAVETQTQ